MSAAAWTGLLVGVGLLLGTWPRRRPEARAAGAAGRPAGALGSGLVPALRGHLGRQRRAAAAELELLAAAETLAAALGAGLDLRGAHGLVVDLTGATPGPARTIGGEGYGRPGDPRATPPGDLRTRPPGDPRATRPGDPRATRPGDPRASPVAALRPVEGESVAEAWRRVGRRSRVAQQVGQALEVSSRTGSPAREAVRTAVSASRDRLAQDGAVDGAAAGARATGRLLTALPLAGPLAVVGLGLDPAQTYAAPLAALSCAAGVGATAVGHVWVRRQVQRARREEIAS
ncbi:hypothetical protein [Arsenicicoccus sp. oral taxon 190]|uniref:hypothetical protein n=1 Tax=Arsenicicoccus sp. oral taxon 190 TaxID=1658671 RepID=UPI00067D85FC|nr:hypothetical protein [Arsenicicoccus sp. oral taxon 190]